MAGETIITVVGNLTADPEVRTTSNGGTVADFTIASTPRQFNRNSGQWEDGDALFLRCSAWDSAFAQLASNVQASLAKGMRVIAQGRLVQRSYQDREGNNRTVVELRVDEIGPALTRNTAQVTRTQGSGAAGNRGGFAGAQQAGGYQGGYQGGASAPAGASGQGSQGSVQAPAQDPWSTPNASSSSFGSFGSSDDFGGSGDEPEF